MVLFTLSLAGALARTTNVAVGSGIGLYYRIQEDRTHLEASSVRSDDQQRVHILPALVGFVPCDNLLKPFHEKGLQSCVARIPSDVRNPRLIPWRHKVSCWMSDLARHPEKIGPQPIFIGFSEGGLASLMFCLLGRGYDPIEIRNFIFQDGVSPPSDEEMATLARNLSEGLFVSVGSPLLGVKIDTKSLLPRAMKRAADKIAPRVMDDLSMETLGAFYERLRLPPGLEDILDLVFVAEGVATFSGGTHLRDTADWLVDQIMSGSKVAVVDDGDLDPVVSLRAAWVKGRLQDAPALVRENHRTIFNSRRIAETVLAALPA